MVIFLADPSASPTVHHVTVQGASNTLLVGLVLGGVAIVMILWSAARINRRSQG